MRTNLNLIKGQKVEREGGRVGWGRILTKIKIKLDSQQPRDIQVLCVPRILIHLFDSQSVSVGLTLKLLVSFGLLLRSPQHSPSVQPTCSLPRAVSFYLVS